jgi:hypothetical protein
MYAYRLIYFIITDEKIRRKKTALSRIVNGLYTFPVARFQNNSVPTCIDKILEKCVYRYINVYHHNGKIKDTISTR